MSLAKSTKGSAEVRLKRVPRQAALSANNTTKYTRKKKIHIRDGGRGGQDVDVHAAIQDISGEKQLFFQTAGKNDIPSCKRFVNR